MKAQDRYRAVVEDLTEVICRFEADGTILFVNEVYCRFFGRPATKLIGSRWQSLAIQEDVADIETRLRTLSPRNPVVVIENRVRSGQGVVHWMQFVNRGFFSAGGRLLETQSVGRDISERRRADLELQQSRSALRALTARLEDVRERERRDLAREIHDTLGHALTDWKFDLAWLARRLEER
jgi:PAS domain S-box-containing protein